MADIYWFCISRRKAMRKYLIILSGLLFVFAGSAFAETYTSTKAWYGVSVTGKRHRKNLRHLLLAGNLKADKKRIYDKYGYTPHRLRYSMAGRRTERWKYLEIGLEFVFDENSKLIEKRTIYREDRRIE
jgi:hypothetical protein